MKIFFLLTIFALSPAAYAADAFDSMAIFQQVDKVTIVVNEQGQAKLASIFRALLTDPNKEELAWSSNGDSKSDVILSCRRGVNSDPSMAPYSCTFKFTKSPNVQVLPKSMSATLGDTSSSLLVNLSFENSQHDTFIFKFFSLGMTASSTKN